MKGDKKMKINLEIDLNDIYPEFDGYGVESIADVLSIKIRKTIENGIEEKLVERVFAEFDDEINSFLREKFETAKELIDKRIEDLINDFLKRKVNITDEWGDVIRENISVMDLLKEKFDNFMFEKVDDRGKPSAYGRQTRIDYMLEQRFKDDVEFIASKVIDEVQRKINKAIKEQLSIKISDRLLNQLNILGE